MPILTHLLSTDVLTRSVADAPDNLYGLEIRQYDSDGKYIAGTGNDFGDKALGEHLTVTLKAMDDCQLLLVARGNGGAIGTLGSKSLDEIRKMSVSSSVITAIDPITGDMNKMPYVLHLEHVKVAVVGGVPVIQSPEGSFDTRLLLKRLATRLTVNWAMADEITSQDYALKEVKLCQVPANFSVIPTKVKTSEWGVTYPSTVAEFIDYYRLTDTELANAKGTKTVWIPANVRGSSPKATSPYYRTKENAPTASSYVELVVDNSVKQERLYYRAYLGGEESTDFNLYENKNYNWTIKVSSANYRDDGRIQLLDQTPVMSTNLVPTSNCFMMQPGTNICFNPYKHEAGTNGWNDQLVNNPSGSATVKTPITTVKVLWQTKDAGTSGELVLGYVISDIQHENLVNIAHAEDINQALVSIKVPQTKGGNAVVAAYNGSNILWSWHIWVTDYVPTPINSYAEYDTAQKNSKNGTVHKWDSPMFHSGGVYENNVLMDRNIGAKKGGFPGITIGENFTVQDVVNTYGLLYQWGRKDPFPTSADGTTEDKNTFFDGYGIVKTIGASRSKASVETSIQNPMTFYAVTPDWCTTATGARWNSASSIYAPGQKTIYDPCPAGWKTPMLFQNSQTLSSDNIQKNSIATNFARRSGGTFGYNEYLNNATPQYDKFLYYYQDRWIGNRGAITENSNPKGGRLFLIGETSINEATIYNSSWLGASSERNPLQNGILTFVGRFGHLWCADYNSTKTLGGFIGNAEATVQVDFYNPGYAWDVRCIQE